MKGVLYGIGIGPGDPELLTLKAINAIKKSDVIVVPHAQNGYETAFEIVKDYLSDKILLKSHFYMKDNDDKRREHRLKVADDICKFLDEGKTVGFITLGDTVIYSTYMYVHKIIKDRGFKTQIIPGITSFSASAAVAEQVLCEGEDVLHIIPANREENIERFLDLPGNKVIMKSGKNITKVLNILQSKGLSENTKIIERCTMKEQRIFNSIQEFYNLAKDEQAGYFSVVLVKDNSNTMEE